LVFLLLAPGAFGVREGGQGIGMMLLGDVGRGGSPIDDWLDQDLIIDYFEIPMAQRQLPDKDLIKFTQIYFPRTMERLLELYDMIVICEEEELFTMFTTSRQHRMMHDAVALEGVGLFNSLPHEIDEFQAWATSPMGELTPHDFAAGYVKLSGGFRIEVNTGSGLPPVFTPFVDFGIEKYIGPELGRLHPRQGSTEWARVRPHDTPFYISWEIGEKAARVSNVANDLDEPWWGSAYRGSPCENPYGGDLFLNMVYWTVGMEPLTNIALVHSVRASYNDYSVRRSVTLALIEFIDSFGANVASLEEELRQISDGRSTARNLYYEQRYEEALVFLDEMSALMADVENRAITLKERAFLWIYLIEWLAVMATTMIVGFVTWTLMVKRRLYREVSVTRAQ
jgi:hypothetical protein